MPSNRLTHTWFGGSTRDQVNDVRDVLRKKCSGRRPKTLLGDHAETSSIFSDIIKPKNKALGQQKVASRWPTALVRCEQLAAMISLAEAQTEKSPLLQLLQEANLEESGWQST